MKRKLSSFADMKKQFMNANAPKPKNTYKTRSEKAKELQQEKDNAFPDAPPSPSTTASNHANTPSQIPESPATPNTVDSSGDNTEEKCDMVREEVIKRLRAVGEPATLFGETDRKRWLRLRQLQISGNFDMLVEQGRNDFAAEHAKLKEEMERQAAEDKKQISEEERQQREKEELEKKEERMAEIEQQLKERTFTRDEQYVGTFLQKIFLAWEIHLDSRAYSEKTSVKGRQDTAFFKQTENYVAPLIKALMKKTLSPAIMEPMLNIVEAMEDREYVKASDWYIRLAIGNAPWPMGVTMVGIHERSGRERIECGKTAHILNNETQRKYIQGLKRLMTKCQWLYPTDPSKMVWN
eukprot:TRINITY_DN57428_c0_g1_i1.p1 TRINITY_DN57428_c0_g1~~TRINITY_DN57428_c0_g1_i1.p1  ORF type:complete len:364 (-),score=48.64 TRINITY_DN57428_c0_g1_i1:116-1171(-)